jgi:hypothetical protein
MELSVEVVRVKNTKHKTNNQKRSAPTTNNQQSAHFECLSVLPVYFVKKIELTVEVVRVNNTKHKTNNQKRSAPTTNNQKRSALRVPQCPSSLFCKKNRAYG